MVDERATKLAQLVVDYSTRINPSDTLLIQAEPAFCDFVELIASAARKKGAKILYDYDSYNPKTIKRLVERMDKDELQDELERRTRLSAACTARILVHAEENPDYLSGVDPKRIAEFETRVASPYKKVLYRQKDGKQVVKWNITGYPSQAEAENADMTLEEYSDFIFNACLIDWDRAEREMQVIKQVFDRASEVRIMNSNGNILLFSLKSRGGEVSSGTHNMPSGEVFYAPEENSIFGSVYFAIPALMMGNEVRGIKLDFNNGVISNYGAESNKQFLESMILNVRGANKVGEFGIGCNYGIKRSTGNPLFDEKIGGTIHLALGQAISKNLSAGGGLNEGDIHWDLVCDLRKSTTNPGGEIYVDSRLVQKDGIWCFR